MTCLPSNTTADCVGASACFWQHHPPCEPGRPGVDPRAIGGGIWRIGHEARSYGMHYSWRGDQFYIFAEFAIIPNFTNSTITII